MRAWSLIVVLLALASPGSAASMAFDDATDDVVVHQERSEDPRAAVVDIQRVEITSSEGDLTVLLTVGDLSLLPALLHEGVAANYAVEFRSSADHPGYALRAQRGPLLTVADVALPLAGWSFTLEDRGARTEQTILGDVVENTLQWTLPAQQVGLQDGAAAVWDAVAWLVPSTGASSVDWSFTDDGFNIKEGRVPGPFEELATLDAVYGRLGSTPLLRDEEGDAGGGILPGSGGGSAAAGIDALAARIADADDRLVIVLELADLAAVEAAADEPGFHAQYALCFTAQANEQCMRAIFRGADMGGTGWGFQRHDVSADAWLDVRGFSAGDTIVWDLPKQDLGLVDQDRLSSWRMQAWNSFDDRGQDNDWASGTTTFTVGRDAPQVPRTLPVPEVPIVCVLGANEGARILDDAAGDAAWSGRSEEGVYGGAGSGIIDALHADLVRIDDDLVVRLVLRDLGDDTAPGDEATSVQYALRLDTAGSDRYALRASYGSGGYWSDGWQFQVHDTHEDAWPEADGWVDGDALYWRVPLEDVGVSDEQTLEGWRLSVWSSARPDRPQINDWAESDVLVALTPEQAGCGEMVEAPRGWDQVGHQGPPGFRGDRPSAPAEVQDTRDAPWTPLLLLLGTLAVLATRRR